jgi:hypothetical protein
MKKTKCIPFVRKTDWLGMFDHGWGNGYVAVPEGHPLFGKDYSAEFQVTDKDKIKFNGNYIGLLCKSLEDTGMISLDLLIDVHCGLTFSDDIDALPIDNAEFIGCKKPTGSKYWVFGFDTCHCDDNESNWPKEKVIEETLKLKEILENFTQP